MSVSVRNHAEYTQSMKDFRIKIAKQTAAYARELREIKIEHQIACSKL